MEGDASVPYQVKQGGETVSSGSTPSLKQGYNYVLNLNDSTLKELV